MKNYYLLLLAIILSSTAMLGQELRFNTYAGYVFDDRVDSYHSNSSYFDGVIQGGFRWGAGIEYNIPRAASIEFQYIRQETNAPTEYRDEGISGGGIQNTDFDLDLNWIMVNGTRYFPVNEVVEPFSGLGIGMGIFSLTNPDNNNQRSITRFAWSIRGGSNFWVSSKVGFRAQASLISAVQSVGGGFYFGTGGVDAGVNTYSSMFQFGFEGGLVFRLTP